MGKMRALSERICRFGYGAGTFCYNRWFKFLFNRDIVFGVDALIKRGAVDAVGDSVTVNGVKRKRYIFIDAASLRTVLVGSAYHGALQNKCLLLHSGLRRQCARGFTEVTHFISLVLRKCNNGFTTVSTCQSRCLFFSNITGGLSTALVDTHYCHTALIAGGVSSVAVNGARCIGFIEPAVRVV